jgi:hypothetical protein
MADPSSSFSAAADASHLADDSNDWKAIRTTVVANQSVLGQGIFLLIR